MKVEKKLAFFIMLFASFQAIAQSNSRISELIDQIRKGPSLYRTDEAVLASGTINPSGSVHAASGPESKAAIKQSIRAAVLLGDMGNDAKEAVATLIEMFPVAEHVAVINNAQYGPGMGSFEDWVQTYVVSQKNKFILEAPFIEYNTLTRCEKWVEASASTTVKQQRKVGTRIVEAQVDIYVTLRINAAACALSRITGYDVGNTRESWRDWYDRNGALNGYVSSTPAPAASEPLKSQTQVESAFPVVDYTTGLRYQITLTTGDVVVGIVDAVDDNSVTIKIDDGGRYNYQKSFIRNRTLLSVVSPATTVSRQDASARAQSQTSDGSIPYEKLLDMSYSGKTMEVTIKNGSKFIGTLGVVDVSILRINVEGTEMPISRSVISRIAPAAEKAPQPKGQDSTASTATPSYW